MRLDGIAPNGPLRAAVNLGNAAIARRTAAGELEGIGPALAARLAGEIGVALEPVVYEGAGRVFADAETGAWDVAFLAIDPRRAEVVAFTRPYLTIEAIYAVRADSPFRDVGEADRPGRRLLVAQGSAYDLHLSEVVRHAALVRAGSPGESMRLFRDGEGDMVAGVRESLEREFGGDPGFRVLPGRFKAIEQAMVLPRHDPRLVEALDDFVARAIADGFIDEHR